jgi:Icc-related predicted phosphoesterase
VHVVRILVTGDLHYALRQLDWVLDHAAEHDAVVLTGDLLDLASTVPIDAQVPVVLGYLARLATRTTTVVASGNHDLTMRDAAGEKAATWLDRAADVGVITDFGSTTLGDIHLSVCPFWDGPAGRSRVDEFLAVEAARAAEAGGPWWWVYHWPPPDLPVSWIGTRSYGDADLAGWIDRWRPSVVLAGHVHQSPFVDGGSWIASTSTGTWVVNAGRQIGPVPSYVVIDTDLAAARWASIDEVDERSLAVPAG